MISSHAVRHALSRRTMLGGLLGGAAYLAGPRAVLTNAIAQQAKAAGKQLLIVYQGGGLSQLESWDPKPGTNTGGPLRPIATSVSGTMVAEWMPHTAKQVHHLAIVRSLSTGEDNHGPGAYLMLTGRRIETGFLYPTLGCWTNEKLTPAGHPVPGYISVGETAKEAAFLGVRHDPVQVLVDKPIANLDRPSFLSEEVESRRLELQRKLNARFGRMRGSADAQAYAQSYDQAVQLMKNKDLFDLAKESDKDRERYGRHEMGQQCLLARRLLEKGVTCVKVTHNGYDTHAENFNVHLDLLEQWDRPFACLVEDLAARGMLGHTLVVAMGEFGRTPNINTRMGRDHWSASWSAAFAGPMIPRGAVIGKTSTNGTEVVERKITAPDLFHTMLSSLGIDPTQGVTVDGQDIPLADPAGKKVPELLAG